MFLYPTAPHYQRRSYQFLAKNDHILRFKALAASFQLEYIGSRIGPRRRAPDGVKFLKVYGSDGFDAGLVSLDEDISIDPSAHQIGELICLSRRRGSRWDCFSEAAEFWMTKSAAFGAALKSASERPRLYPWQHNAGVEKKDWDRYAHDGFDERRYNAYLPFAIYNVMLVKRRPDGIAERMGIGTIHVAAFWQSKPKWKMIALE